MDTKKNDKNGQRWETPVETERAPSLLITSEYVEKEKKGGCSGDVRSSHSFLTRTHELSLLRRTLTRVLVVELCLL